MLIGITVIAPWALVDLAGEIDHPHAERIRAVVAVLVADRDVTELTVDLTGVTFIGAAGLGAVAAASEVMDTVDGRLMLVGATAPVRQVFVLGGLGRVLPLVSLPTTRSDAPAGDAPGPAPSPYEDDDLRRQLFGLGRLLQSETAVGAELGRVVRTAVGTVPGCTAATVALMAQGGSRSGGRSDRVAMEVDVTQYVAGAGPAPLAARAARRVRLERLGVDDRYHHFAPLALRAGAPAVGAGAQAVLSMPMLDGDETIGALDVYRDRAFDPAAEAQAGACAAQAATALAPSEAYARARQLARSTQRRFEIVRDTGIAEDVLAGLHGCSVEEAQRRLRSAAAANVETVAETARRIIGNLPAGSAPKRAGR